VTQPVSTPGTVMARRRRQGPYRVARPLWAVPVFTFLTIFFIVPLAGSIAQGAFGGPAIWTNYTRLFLDPYYFGVLIQTLIVSAVTTLLCLLVGYPAAYVMSRHAGRWNGVILFCLIAPLLTSIIMRTFGWRVLLARRGVLNTILMDTGIISQPLNLIDGPFVVYLSLVHVLVPFMVLSIVAVLRGIDPRLEESARSLGAGRWRAFLSVTLPLSLDGIATGCILVFVLTNGSFLTMLLLGGGKVVTR
jgi:putative spermidine/putrescine transport system permease protein